uniref:Neurotransmitter-gated ion-channel ligand-binding domain-containing protein n=1 Tax=Parascaris univalens TaxID=6257 RepID=A0A914ZSF1_PARUN
MIVAVFLSLPFVYTSSDDIVINRPLNRVEFSDLLLEYNSNYADEPTESIEVEVALNIEQAKWSFGFAKELFLVIELYESWRDLRLKFTGETSVNVPRGTMLWTPDTYFVNTPDSHWQPQSSLRLRYDGTIFRKRRAKLTVPCDIEINLVLQNDRTNCTLVLGSFDNVGASSITYHITNVSFPVDVGHTIKFSIDHLNSTTTVSTFNGEILSRSILVFSVDIGELLLSRWMKEKVEF